MHPTPQRTGLTGIGCWQNWHAGSGSRDAFAWSTGAPQFGQCVGTAQGGPVAAPWRAEEFFALGPGHLRVAPVVMQQFLDSPQVDP
jgi:hypothetical protein